VLTLAILIAACGGSASHPRGRPEAVHPDGRATGDYVRETSATRVGFLVPAGGLAAQGATSFDISRPPPTNSNAIVVGPKFTLTSRVQVQHWEKTWFMGPSITGTTPERAHVELLVTGDPDHRIYLSFEESRGFIHVGPTANGESAVKGAHGQRIVRTPAVMIVPTLTTRPENSCDVSGMVVSRGRPNLHISLIDY